MSSESGVGCEDQTNKNMALIDYALIALSVSFTLYAAWVYWG